ncbi:MAG: sigma-54-dependent Fis family transcriptional regulator [Candidatus Marinimicrobia bacterium]|nr:sigma-54-dependent Fis family transcriptional regulator [Candidatus Neomarinimicrobiota bacterium]
MKFQILIIDDETLVCRSIKRILEDNEKKVYTAITVENARTILQDQSIDLVLLDYKLGETDGLTVLKEIKEKYSHISIIMLTAFGTIDLAVQAMKSGAYDFIQKEEDANYIQYTVQRALDTLRLKKEVEELRKKCEEEISFPEIISFSPSMQHVIKLVKEFAQTDAIVLLTGETGTGKSLIAKYTHYNSSRFANPFVVISCAAIPHELIESELFGYEKGAFTGARTEGKRGLIEQANGGTLLLDEISELNLDLQTKLLHVIENSEFYRVGAVRPSRVDVRFIAATNTDLYEQVNTKNFRPDLFYRLNVAHLKIPTLKERKEDILPLTKLFIDEFNQTFNKSISKIDKKAELFLLTAPWCGNVRELRNYIERAILLTKRKTLMLEDIFSSDFTKSSGTTYPNDVTFKVQLNQQPDTNLLHEAQMQIIEQALELTGQNRSRAAKILGIPRTSLQFYIKRYQMDK